MALTISDADRINALEIQLDTAKRALARYARESNWRTDDWNVMAIFSPDYGAPGRVAKNALKRIEKRGPRGADDNS